MATGNRDSFFDQLLGSLLALPRIQKQLIVLVSDCFLLILGLWLAFSLRLGTWFVPELARQWFLLLTIPIIAVPIFVKLGLYRAIIRYVGDQVLWAIMKSMSLTTMIWAFLAFMLRTADGQGVPRTVPWIFWLLGIGLISSSRFFARYLFSTTDTKNRSNRFVLIYGAGTAGRQLAASLRKGNELRPIGFIDDDPALVGKEIDGLRVFSRESLASIIKKSGIKDVIVTLPSASNKKKREVVQFLEQLSVKVRILPSVSSIAQGRHLVNMIREVDIGDLLGRDPVSPDPVLLGRCVQDKNVLVTGAGGSIGSELCRQLLALNPAKLLLMDSNEAALFQIHRTLTAQSDTKIIPVLGSTTDETLVTHLLGKFQVDTIYHAAAHKHVALIEQNVLECVRNNIFGTYTLAQTAYQAGVKTFVLISTDKAVRPTSVMGATKRFSELIIQHFNGLSKKMGLGLVFCAVRFGNVLGSSGSVVPIFKDQIAQGGPITVTHPEVTRYFMSIHEAVELVIQAGSLAEGGDLFLLDMGEPVKIVDLAKNMISLAGLNGDIEISFIGLRPGEKLHEELLIGVDGAKGTLHSKILRAQEPHVTEETLNQLLESLKTALIQQKDHLVREILFKFDAKSKTASPHSFTLPLLKTSSNEENQSYPT